MPFVWCWAAADEAAKHRRHELVLPIQPDAGAGVARRLCERRGGQQHCVDLALTPTCCATRCNNLGALDLVDQHVAHRARSWLQGARASRERDPEAP